MKRVSPGYWLRINLPYILWLLIGAVLIYSQQTFNGNVNVRGNVQSGYQSGKSGFTGWSGKTDGGVQAIGVPDAAGGPTLYMMPATAPATAGQIFQDTGTATCPTLAAGSPAFTCRQLTWIPHSFAAAESSSSTWTITGATHNLGSCDIQVQTWNNASPQALITPTAVTCDQSGTFNVVITFGSAQVGRVVLSR
jgi:hypothetical protein